MFNSEWHEGFSPNQARNIIIAFLCLIVVFILLKQKDIVKMFNWYDQNKEWQRKEIEREYSGIVVAKGRNHRNNTYIKLNDSSKIFENEEKIWKNISIGDSVNKPKNSKLLYVYHDFKTIVLNYDDVYKYRDSLIRTGNY